MALQPDYLRHSTPTNLAQPDVLPTGFYAAVVGPTGSGKSQLINVLEAGGYPVKREVPPAENPYLADFYDQMATRKPDQSLEVALLSQLCFLEASLAQSAQIKDRVAHGETVFHEMPWYGHEMYAYLLWQSGVLDDEMWNLYRATVAQQLPNLIVPEVTLVVVPPTIEHLHGQILGRAREDESRQKEAQVDVRYWASQLRYWQAKLIQNQRPYGSPLYPMRPDKHNWLTEAGAHSALAECRQVLMGIGRSKSTGRHWQ